MQAKECDALRSKLICIQCKNLLHGILMTVQGGMLVVFEELLAMQ